MVDVPRKRIRNRDCWLETTLDWRGDKMYNAATVWAHNLDYVYRPPVFDTTPEEAWRRMEAAILRGDA